MGAPTLEWITIVISNCGSELRVFVLVDATAISRWSPPGSSTFPPCFHLNLWQHLTAFLTLFKLVPSDSVPTSCLLPSLFIPKYLQSSFSAPVSQHGHLSSLLLIGIGLYTSIYSVD